MNSTQKTGSSPLFVHWFRNTAPYINAFRGRTFVIAFGGEIIGKRPFASLAQDIALLTSLGIRLVLVHGIRPQIEQRLRQRGLTAEFVGPRRITDRAALQCLQEAVGTVRVEIEALLSMGLINTPMAGANIRIISGNFITARPLGVVDGIDFQHTGSIRRMDQQGMVKALDDGAILLLSPLGYSPTGECFNLTALETASAAAVALQADKLILLVGAAGLQDARRPLVRELSLSQAAQCLKDKPRLPGAIATPLRHALAACQQGVKRSHLIAQDSDGALLQELFTRDGCGTMISADRYEGIRQAGIGDIGGILQLISPLEEQGVLLKRSREHLEMEIGDYTVVARDGMIIGCIALHPSATGSSGEIACLAVHPDYRDQGYGEQLLAHLEHQAQQRKLQLLYVLTTQADHWFQERGFKPTTLRALPVQRRALYNYRRNSKILAKTLAADPQA